MSVLDASVYVEALTAATPLGDAARARVAAPGRWHAPALLPAEVVSAIRRLVLHDRITTRVADAARGRLLATRLVLHPFAPYADRVWELRDTLTTYDAWYVAVAERLATTLVTTDGPIARAPGPTCRIDVVTL